MKNKILLLSAILVFGLLPTSDALTVKETTSEKYLINRGYSAATVDMVNAKKAAANGEKYTPKPARDQAKYKYWWPLSWLRRTYIYLDPAMETPDFMEHDIKMTPSINDL